jgi:hypothetical protein
MLFSARFIALAAIATQVLLVSLMAVAAEPISGKSPAVIPTTQISSIDSTLANIDPERFVVTSTVEADGKIVDRHRTIFLSGIGYNEIGQEGRFINVFGDDSVIMLDRLTQVRCEIPQSQLLDLTLRAAGAAKQSEQSASFGIDAQPVRRGDRYAVSFGPFSYDLLTIQPAHASMVNDIARFNDAALRLNVARQQGVPPFARIAMSQRMAADGRMPIETKMEVHREGTVTKFISRSEISSASESDSKQMETIETLLKMYQPVSLSEFPAQ